MLAVMVSCFSLFGPHQHGTANKQAQFPQKLNKNESPQNRNHPRVDNVDDDYS